MRTPGPTSRSPLMARRAFLGGAAGTLTALGLSACGPDPEPSPGASAAQCGAGGRKSITYLGDSLTNGTGQDSGVNSRFPAIIRRTLLTPARVEASNGSGYVVVGPASDARAFPDQALQVRPDTSLVVVLGSRNDMHSYETIAEVREAAERTYERLAERAPGVPVLVVGPPWINHLPSDSILAVRDEVRAAALAADVTWVDPIEEGWFAEQEDLRATGYSRMISEDRVHPNDEGHAYLAERLLPHIEELIC